MKNKNNFYKIAPYLCGIFYGVWGGFAIMSIAGWLIFQGEYNKAYENEPIWGNFPMYVNAQLIIGVIFLILFFVTLFVNIKVFQKTPKTVSNMLFEIVVPLIIFIPSAFIWDAIYCNYLIKLI